MKIDPKELNKAKANNNALSDNEAEKLNDELQESDAPPMSAGPIKLATPSVSQEPSVNEDEEISAIKQEEEDFTDVESMMDEVIGDDLISKDESIVEKTTDEPSDEASDALKDSEEITDIKDESTSLKELVQDSKKEEAKSSESGASLTKALASKKTKMNAASKDEEDKNDSVEESENEKKSFVFRDILPAFTIVPHVDKEHKKDGTKSKLKQAIGNGSKEESNGSKEDSRQLDSYKMFAMRVLKEKPEKVELLNDGHSFKVKHKNIEWTDDKKTMNFYVKEDSALDYAIDTAIQTAMVKGWDSLQVSSEDKNILKAFEEKAKVVGIKIKTKEVDSKPVKEDTFDSRIEDTDELEMMRIM